MSRPRGADPINPGAISPASGNQLLIRIADLIEQTHAVHDLLIYLPLVSREPVAIHRSPIGAFQFSRPEAAARISMELLSAASKDARHIRGEGAIR
ncbi:MAG TPA: hypothetical protein VFZ80_03865 [Acidimicrobiia bacterium]